MSPPTKGQVTRQQIIQAAYRLFLDKGYAATSIRDIVAAAGITIGGFYAHFASKEELFSAVFDTCNPYQHLIPLLAQANGDTLEALLQDAARRVVETLSQQPEGVKLIFIEVVEFQGKHFAPVFTTGFPQMIGLIQRLAGFKQQIRDLPPATLARFFAGLFFSFYITGVFFPDIFKTGEAEIQQFVDIYLHGILEKKA